MKHRSLTSRSLAFLLTAILVLGAGTVGLTAMAAQTVTVKIANIPRQSDAESSNANWGHPELKLMNGWVIHPETYFTVKILDDYTKGNAVYCMEPASALHTGDALTEQKNTVDFYRKNLPWNGTLSGEWQRKLIAAILYHGYRGTCDLNGWVTQNASGRAKLAKYWATQLLVWEAIVGERDPNFKRIPVPAGNVSVDNLVMNGNPMREDIFAAMADMEKKVQEELLCPSFVNQNGGLSETFSLRYDTTTKKYQTTVTDTNGVLSNWEFSGRDLYFIKNGNQMTIQADKPLDGTVEFEASKTVPTSSLVVWSDGNYNSAGEGKQDLVAYGENTGEDFIAYAKVKTEAKQVGKLTLTKVDKDYPENKLAGGEFTVYENPEKLSSYDASKCPTVGPMIEVQKGVYELGDLPLGSYFVIETKTPEGFLRDKKAYPVELTKAGETVTVSNDANTRAFINERSTTKPTTQPTTQSTTKPTTKPSTQSTTRPTTQPMTKSTTLSTTQPSSFSTTTSTTTTTITRPSTTSTTRLSTTTVRPTTTTTRPTTRRAKSVNTGDESRPALWTLVAFITAVAAGVLVHLRREKNE